MLWHSAESLEAIFIFYATSVEGMDAAQAGGERSREEMAAEAEEMSLSELYRLCIDFNLAPEFVNVNTLGQIFRLVNREGGDGAADDNCNNCSFEEFILVLARLAVHGHQIALTRIAARRRNATAGASGFEIMQWLLAVMESSEGISRSICTGANSAGFNMYPKGLLPPKAQTDAAVALQCSARSMLARRRVAAIREPEPEVEEERRSVRPRHAVINELRLVFADLCCKGESDVKHTMGCQKFYTTVRDAKVAAPSIACWPSSE